MTKINECSDCGNQWNRSNQPKRVYIRESESTYDSDSWKSTRKQKWVAVGWRCPNCLKMWNDPK
jgi:hypothetical protein